MESPLTYLHWPRGLVAVALAYGSYRVVKFLASAMRPADYPPGPPTLPGIGNLHQIPLKQPYRKFAEWSTTYGPIMGLKVGPANLVIVSDPSYMQELFTKRGNFYSGRRFGYIPTQHVFGEYQDIHILGMQYGPMLRKWRSAASDLFNGPGQKQTRPMQEATASKLCHSLLQATPADTPAHLKHWALATPLLAITGQRLEDRGQAFADRFYTAQKKWLELLEPGNAPPVDFIAPLRWVPEWCAEWKRKAGYVRSYMVDEYFAYLETAKDLQRSGDGSFRSLMSKVLDDEVREKNESVRWHDAEVAYFGGGLLDAAVDTSLAAISSFVLFMAAYPEAQAVAFAEIDGLQSREPPTGASIADLPYLKACLLETYRLRPPAPSGLPHILEQDDVVAGYTIPKGTTVLGNVYGMQHDPDAYHEPEEFMPERFLQNPLGLKPGVSPEGRRITYAFGAGRRICPGEQFANTSALTAMAKVLWAFEICPAEELDLSPATGYHDGLVLHPLPFKVEMRLRDEERRDGLLRDYERSQEAIQGMRV
ncbi:cytochrome P450 21 [Microdochium bolleyi]|uniref:Cytochrome P450 21 n=1 Tax=Microdochium bolleyi TaxID=196109 RepID=A0A136IXA2_9PEZI|nr:cytochrome P450 21 [Microdochium bolleyi]